MHILDEPLDLDPSRHGAPPADRDEQGRRGMHDDTVRSHRTGHVDLSIGRIGEQRGGLGHTVTVNEVESRAIDEPTGQVLGDLNPLTIADADHLQPGRQQVTIELVSGGHRLDVDLGLGPFHLVHGS